LLLVFCFFFFALLLLDCLFLPKMQNTRIVILGDDDIFTTDTTNLSLEPLCVKHLDSALYNSINCSLLNCKFLEPYEYITQIFASSIQYNYLFIATSELRLYALGNNDFSQCAVPNEAKLKHITRLKFFDGKHIKSIACGRSFSLFLTDKHLYGVGDNQCSQLGVDSTLHFNFTEPIIVPNIEASRVKQIACTSYCAFVLYDDGNVYFAGYNGSEDDLVSQYELLKFEHGSNNNEPPTRISKIACGSLHAMFLSTHGYIYGYGNNSVRI